MEGNFGGDEDGLIFYDSDDDNFDGANLGHQTGDDGVGIAFAEEDDSLEASPPGPPGSNLLRTRKRTLSFHKSAKEIESHDTLKVLLDPRSPEFDPTDSDTSTDCEEWEGFIMDYNEIYSRSNSNSDNSSNNSSSNGSTLERRNSNDPAGQLREIFANLQKSRSRSFTMRTPRNSGPRLPSFEEDESSEI